MGALDQVVFAFIAGLVVGGIAASILELVAEKRLSFAAPFFSTDHLPRFTLAVLAAGPFMLVNDALLARKNGEITVGGLTGIMATASIWVWAIGTVAVNVAVRVVDQSWM